MSPSAPQSPSANHNNPTPGSRRCYNCGELGHLASNCRNQTPAESKGSNQKSRNRIVHFKQENAPHTRDPAHPDPMSFLFSDDSDQDHCKQIVVKDNGSRSVCVPLQIGVPVYGLVDTGADITIIGAQLLKKIAAVAKLKKRNFKTADKTPHGYDRRPFELHGRMELTLSFDGKEMKTMVYIKMDAADQLLLSEGVCRQLGIVTYHPSIQDWKGGRLRGRKRARAPKSKAQVPIVRIRNNTSTSLSYSCCASTSRVRCSEQTIPAKIKSSLGTSSL